MGNILINSSYEIAFSQRYSQGETWGEIPTPLGLVDRMENF